MRVFSNNGLGKLVVVFLMLGLFLGLGSTMPAAAAEISVTVTGDGVANPVTFTQAELEAMDQVQVRYSSINTWPTKKMYVASGVKLADLLTAAGIKDEAKLIKVKSTDGFSATFTVKELMQDTRYYYPGLKDNHEYFGYIPGSTEGAVEVDTILALANAESDNFNHLSGRDAPILMMGQRFVTEQTNSAFAKYVGTIEVTTAAPAKWENPVAAPVAGTVEAGTKVALSTSDMDGDNIYYTTDGSDPTFESPMYNWIKKRWWGSRSGDLATINHPVDVDQSMTIKAVAIGFGKENSDIVSFEYQVPGIAVTGVSIAEDDQVLEVDQTAQLTAVVAPENATNKNVIWSTSSEAIATVSETGLVTAVSEGTAEITVTTEDGDFTDTITVTVVPDIPLTIVVKENGIETQTFDYDMNEWETTHQQRYSARDSMPAYRLGVAEGVFLEDILADAGINVDQVSSFKFISTDQQVMPVSKSELLDLPRNYYPNIFSADQEIDAELVKPMLALKSYVGSRNNSTPPAWDNMDYQNTIRLFVGQKDPGDMNYGLFAKWINKVEVEMLAAAPAAAFTADPTSGAAPLTVNFTDQSTNSPTSWAWDFDNDGTVDSTDQNPTYEYSAAGAYSVKLTVTNAAGSDDEVKTDYITVDESPAMDVLYDGTVALTPGETFSVTAYNSGTAYPVSKTTALGALQAAAVASGFTYGVTDKNYENSGALLLDNVGDYPYVKGGSKWFAYVNEAYKDGYNNPAGALNLIELANGDRAEFYYAAGISDPADLDAVKAAATAAVKTVAATGASPTDWTLQLSGAKNTTVSKAYFENGLACSSSTHQVFWTDDDGNVWGGVPLWLLVGMVDDDPDVGPYHFNFNDGLAAQSYEVNVIAGDGWKATLDSAAIARNDGYIIANTLNGEPLPLQTEGGKGCWPLHLKGSAVFGGQQVGNIVKIELSDLPVPSEGWTLKMLGDIGDTITQKEFEEGLACTGSGHYKEWTDNEGNVWSGVPLWVLLGAVDDIETGGHWTFNDALAASYTVKVVAEDGYNKIFNGTDVAGSDGYIVANECNGAPLTDAGPLRLVGAGVANADGSLSGSSVGNIARIEIPELQTPLAAPGSWNLALNGKISDVFSQAEFEAALACPRSGHYVEWTDIDSNVWSGMPLWFLTGWVDDRQPHAYNANQASAGYTILVKAGDGYTKDFASTDVAWSNNYIIANKCNGAPLTGSWPLRLIGAGVANADGSLTGTSVGNIAEIELTSFETALPAPDIHIIKYAEDHTTILDEKTVDYLWMQENLDVIGDGTTVYRYEGITNNPDDVWDADETYPGGFKIENAVKGTRIRDLCDLVGGMGAGTDVILVAKDGYETTLPYSSIYTDPAVQACQGDAILAWWGDGKYVPDYADGMRLFFTPDDHIYGQWDMHETLPSNYWHYYFSGGVQYPSCAGLSPKWITTVKLYSVPQGDWTLKLDGRDIGGIEYDVTKTYFEQALACQFGANHKATYTDSEEQVWEGMPLWFLAGFVDDADQHSNDAFNNELAEAGYQVVITSADGHSVTINSADIIRNNNYIVANSLNGELIPESDSSWPLRLVGPAVSGETSISQIVSIELVSAGPAAPIYTVTPEADAAYTAGTTPEGINTMTVNDGISGFKYFAVSITPVVSHSGNETVVFTHLRNGSQLELNATRADFDQVGTAQAGFNVKAGDVIKVYLVDELTNAIDHNPVILQ